MNYNTLSELKFYLTYSDGTERIFDLDTRATSIDIATEYQDNWFGSKILNPEKRLKIEGIVNSQTIIKQSQPSLAEWEKLL